MKMISKKDSVSGSHSKNCNTREYSFGDKDIDVGVASIKGRYPEEGYCMNLKCKELVFVLEGKGTLCFDNQEVSFAKGDAILIDKGEKYYWKDCSCKVSMTCTPAWSPEQYKVVL